MTTPKKKKAKKVSKKKVNEEQLHAARLYKKAWDQLFDKRPPFAQREIIDDPQGRRASELAHEVSKLVEAWIYEEEHGSFNDGPNEWKD
jgi:hypothetical protein